eukprot:UN18767
MEYIGMHPGEDRSYRYLVRQSAEPHRNVTSRIRQWNHVTFYPAWPNGIPAPLMLEKNEIRRKAVSYTNIYKKLYGPARNNSVIHT